MAIDNSGTIIAGNSELPGTDNPPITHAFRWTPEGMVDLGTLGGRNSKVSGMSRDGSVIVGMADGRAFRWTKAGGMTNLSTFEAAPFVSSDGSVVAGGKGGHVFRWTAQTGVVDLKVDAPGFPAGMSSDGSVLVFFSVNGAALKSLHRWTLAEGAQDVLAMLRESGEDMTRITLNIPVKLSANGKYVLALGTFPDGTAQPIVIEFVD